MSLKTLCDFLIDDFEQTKHSVTVIIVSLDLIFDPVEGLLFLPPHIYLLVFSIYSVCGIKTVSRYPHAPCLVRVSIGAYYLAY